MSLKYFFSILIIMGLIAIVVFKYFPEQTYLLIIATLMIIAIFGIIDQYQKRQSEVLLKKEASLNDKDDNEYHNDFSKVPAGTPDSFQPPPRSIGYGYGDGGRSLDEDLQRIGLENKDKKLK